MTVKTICTGVLSCNVYIYVLLATPLPVILVYSFTSVLHVISEVMVLFGYPGLFHPLTFGSEFDHEGNR
jgi:hypothetical protein